MIPVRCLIVEDEKPAQRLLENYIGRVSGLSIDKICNNAAEALNYLRSSTPDLIFVDINMPEINGIEFIAGIDKTTAVIITTAYSEHAMEGFDLGVVDYLLKPFSFTRFLKAINKYYTIARGLSAHNDSPPDLPAEEAVSLIVKTSKGVQKINYREIIYIKSYGNYAKILTGEENYIVRETLTSLIKQLPGTHFTRIHRSYIVALNYVTAIKPDKAVLGGTVLPIGSLYLEAFRKAWTGKSNIA